MFSLLLNYLSLRHNDSHLSVSHNTNVPVYSETWITFGVARFRFAVAESQSCCDSWMCETTTSVLSQLGRAANLQAACCTGPCTVCVLRGRRTVFTCSCTSDVFWIFNSLYLLFMFAVCFLRLVLLHQNYCQQ